MSFVLVFAALVVGCGGSNGGSKDNGGEAQQSDTLEGLKCYENGVYSCEQNDKIVLLCDEGKWFKLKQCSETQTCNSNTGNCEYVMSNNFAFGGINTSLVLRKWKG